MPNLPIDQMNPLDVPIKRRIFLDSLSGEILGAEVTLPDGTKQSVPADALDSIGKPGDEYVLVDPDQDILSCYEDMTEPGEIKLVPPEFEKPKMKVVKVKLEEDLDVGELGAVECFISSDPIINTPIIVGTEILVAGGGLFPTGIIPTVTIHDFPEVPTLLVKVPEGVKVAAAEVELGSTEEGASAKIRYSSSPDEFGDIDYGKLPITISGKFYAQADGESVIPHVAEISEHVIRGSVDSVVEKVSQKGNNVKTEEGEAPTGQERINVAIDREVPKEEKFKEDVTTPETSVAVNPKKAGKKKGVNRIKMDNAEPVTDPTDAIEVAEATQGMGGAGAAMAAVREGSLISENSNMTMDSKDSHESVEDIPNGSDKHGDGEHSHRKESEEEQIPA